MKPEPLSGADAFWFRADRPYNRMIITGILELDPPGDAEAFRARVESVLLSFDRFSKHITGGPEHPAWTPDPSFQFDEHYSEETVDGPLAPYLDHVLSTPLDNTRSPWRVRYVRGETTTVIFRVHHAIADGIGLLSVLRALEDGAPPRAEAHREFANLREPTPSRSGPAGILSPMRGPKSLLRLATMPKDLDTCFKGRLGPNKGAAWSAELELDRVKRIARKHRVKINDVLLSVLSGAVRDYLLTRGDNPNLGRIRVSVPIDLGSEARTPMGNHFGLLFVELPIEEPDAVRRLREVEAQTAALKASDDPVVSFAAVSAAGRGPLVAAEKITQLFSQRTSAVITNVIGPAQPIVIAGSRVSKLGFWVPQAGRVGLGFSIISYCGRVVIGASVDKDLVDDPTRLIASLAEHVDTLERA